MTLLAIFGCAPGTREALSSEESLVMEATIEQRTLRKDEYRQEFLADHVCVMLRDKSGHAVERRDLCVEINGMPLTLRAVPGHGRDHRPAYRLDERVTGRLAPDALLEFTLIWPDGSHFDAGSVRMPKALARSQLDLPTVAVRGEPIAISWEDLAEPAELVIYRDYEYTDMSGGVVREPGSSDDPYALRRTIGPGLWRRASGRLVLPQSFLADHEGRRVTAVTAMVSATHAGTVRDTLARGSSIHAVRTLQLRCELVDVEA